MYDMYVCMYYYFCHPFTCLLPFPRIFVTTLQNLIIKHKTVSDLIKMSARVIQYFFINFAFYIHEQKYAVESYSIFVCNFFLVVTNHCTHCYVFCT